MDAAGVRSLDSSILEYFEKYLRQSRLMVSPTLVFTSKVGVLCGMRRVCLFNRLLVLYPGMYHTSTRTHHSCIIPARCRYWYTLEPVTFSRPSEQPSTPVICTCSWKSRKRASLSSWSRHPEFFSHALPLGSRGLATYPVEHRVSCRAESLPTRTEHDRQSRGRNRPEA